MRGVLIRKLVTRFLSVGLALLAFLVCALTASTGWGLVLAAAALGAIALERRIPTSVDTPAETALVAAAVLVAYSRQLEAGFEPALAATGLVLLGLVLLTSPLRQAGGLEPQTANLSARAWEPLVATRLETVLLGLLAVLTLAAAISAPTLIALVATLLVAAVAGTAGLGLTRRRLRPTTADGAVRQAVQRHQPEFLLHFSAPPGSEYQVTMWLPYLERINRKFLVVLREPQFLAPIAAATTAPVIYCPTPRSLDEVLVPSLKVAFYVNHGAKNSHCIGFTQLTHIQLHHGDSDKAPSANPVTALFDRIFVAGEAAIERYARAGINIPVEKFRVVGRPQVESIQVRHQPVPSDAPATVLYTPTWTGHNAHANYCSLAVAEPILRRLLDRGVTVILRAHPYTNQNPASARQLRRLTELLATDRERSHRPHVWGPEASRKLSLAECMNRSDALISDVSGVISDYLRSGKPFAVTDMTTTDADAFAEQFPLAAAGYRLPRDMRNLDGVLDQLLSTDPLAAHRWATRRHYLGDFPDETYGAAFVNAARQELDRGRPSTARPPRPADAAVT